MEQKLMFAYLLWYSIFTFGYLHNYYIYTTDREKWQHPNIVRLLIAYTVVTLVLIYDIFTGNIRIGT